MKETMITCACCGAEVPPEDVIYVGTQAICPDCAETETFVCDHCGFRFWNGDNMGDGRFDLCESCRDEYYVTCSECGQLLRNSEAYYEDSDEDGETPLIFNPHQMVTIKAVFAGLPLLVQLIIDNESPAHIENFENMITLLGINHFL